MSLSSGAPCPQGRGHLCGGGLAGWSPAFVCPGGARTLFSFSAEPPTRWEGLGAGLSPEAGVCAPQGGWGYSGLRSWKSGFQDRSPLSHPSRPSFPASREPEDPGLRRRVGQGGAVQQLSRFSAARSGVLREGRSPPPRLQPLRTGPTAGRGAPNRGSLKAQNRLGVKALGPRSRSGCLIKGTPMKLPVFGPF